MGVSKLTLQSLFLFLPSLNILQQALTGRFLRKQTENKWYIQTKTTNRMPNERKKKSKKKRRNESQGPKLLLNPDFGLFAQLPNSGATSAGPSSSALLLTSLSDGCGVRRATSSNESGE